MMGISPRISSSSSGSGDASPSKGRTAGTYAGTRLAPCAPTASPCCGPHSGSTDPPGTGPPLRRPPVHPAPRLAESTSSSPGKGRRWSRRWHHPWQLCPRPPSTHGIKVSLDHRGAAPRLPSPPAAPEGRGAHTPRAARVKPRDSPPCPVPSLGPVTPDGKCCPMGASTRQKGPILPGHPGSATALGCRDPRAAAGRAARGWSQGPGVPLRQLGMGVRRSKPAAGRTPRGLHRELEPAGAGMPTDPLPGWGRREGLPGLQTPQVGMVIRGEEDVVLPTPSAGYGPGAAASSITPNMVGPQGPAVAAPQGAGSAVLGDGKEKRRALAERHDRFHGRRQIYRHWSGAGKDWAKTRCTTTEIQDHL